MLKAGEANNVHEVLCIPRAIAAPSSGQYWLLNRTTVLSPIILLCATRRCHSAYQHVSICKQLACTACLEQTRGHFWVTTLLSHSEIHPPSVLAKADTRAASLQMRSPMASVYHVDRRVLLWLLRLNACGEDGRVCASLEACMLSALLGVVSFRCTVGVGARNIAPDHEQQ